MGKDCFEDADDVNYHPETGVYWVEFDDDPLGVAVIKAIGKITDTDVTELEPLQKAICMDIDALNNLFQRSREDAPHTPETIEFTYHNHEVTVFSFGRIELKPRDAGSEDETEHGSGRDFPDSL